MSRRSLEPSFGVSRSFRSFAAPLRPPPSARRSGRGSLARCRSSPRSQPDNLYLGAAFDGSRLSKLYAEDVTAADIRPKLDPLFLFRSFAAPLRPPPSARRSGRGSLARCRSSPRSQRRDRPRRPRPRALQPLSRRRLRRLAAEQALRRGRHGRRLSSSARPCEARLSSSSSIRLGR
jgi:hypothetical protein